MTPYFFASGSNQDGLAADWKALRYREINGEEPEESRFKLKWPNVRAKLERHGRLTTTDIATMFGATRNSTARYMRHRREAGHVTCQKAPGSKLFEWRLAT